MNDDARSYRERRAAREAEDARTAWQFRRAVARVAVIEVILADYATSYCGLPVRRREVAPLQSAVEPAGVTWSIDREVVVEFLFDGSGPSRLRVHDFALLRPIKKRLRSRHVTVEYLSNMGVAITPPAFTRR